VPLSSESCVCVCVCVTRTAFLCTRDAVDGRGGVRGPWQPRQHTQASTIRSMMNRVLGTCPGGRYVAELVDMWKTPKSLRGMSLHQSQPQSPSVLCFTHQRRTRAAICEPNSIVGKFGPAFTVVIGTLLARDCSEIACRGSSRSGRNGLVDESLQLLL